MGSATTRANQCKTATIRRSVSVELRLTSSTLFGWYISGLTQAGFNISVLLNYFIHKVLEGESEYITRWYKWLVVACLVLPLTIMIAPLVYKPGFGPSGFPVMLHIEGSYKMKFMYLFCGWYSLNPTQDEITESLAKFFNNSLPVIILSFISIWIGVKIHQRRKLLESQDVEFTRKEKNILRTRWIPFMCTLVWVLNTVLRGLTFPEEDVWVGFKWTYLLVNTLFDLLPFFECSFFILYIMYSVPLKHLRFMSIVDSEKSLIGSTPE